jgi:murein DD-endopeptidase MepM/ murein hydrolase activator NlpD
MTKLLSILIAAVLTIVAFTSASAQTPEPPPGPVYIVQEGDTLWDIALRFNVSMDEIISYNSLPSQDIFIGDRLVIPNLEELSGVLSIQLVQFGETLHSLSRQNRIDPSLLLRLNHIVSPAELYVGYGLILLQSDLSTTSTGRDTILPGETFVELAVRQNTSPWLIGLLNNQTHSATILPGDLYAIPGGGSTAAPNGFPAIVTSAFIAPLPIIQGQTEQLSVTLDGPATLGGMLVDHPLNFFRSEDGLWIALQGIHVMTDPGLYPLRLDVSLPSGQTQSFEQMVLVQDGYFRQDPILQVEPSTIDPAVTEPENEFITSLVSPATPEKMWTDVFRLPVDAQFCIRSMYGNRRSFNGSEYIYFHSGVDYGICSDTHPFDIYAPASGIVIFAGPLTVRGNATIIDHGWGIYSGLWHQEEFYVQVGDHVEAGQLIGKIGSTGRVTGPHLHWEIWVNGVQANPLQWLDEVFPH